MHGILRSYGRLSTTHVLCRLPDPGAWNSCMHAFPEKTVVDLLWMVHCLTHNSMCLEMGFETLDFRPREHMVGVNMVLAENPQQLNELC